MKTEEQKNCICGCGKSSIIGNYLPEHDQKLRTKLETDVGGLENLKVLVEISRSFSKGDMEEEIFNGKVRELFSNKGDKLPNDISLPFFAYGILKKNEIAYPTIAEFVLKANPAQVKGELRIRDGILLFYKPENAEGQEINGDLIYFNKGDDQKSAYVAISSLEPWNFYRWGYVNVTDLSSGEEVPANVLERRGTNNDGSQLLESGEDWSSKNDPLFSTALDVIDEMLKFSENLGASKLDNNEIDPLMSRFFCSQMAYLLLWAAIERYVSLRWGFKGGPVARIKKITGEQSFREALQGTPAEGRSVYRADDPSKKKCALDRNNPESSILYYYQVRSNITHRGKGAVREREHVEHSLKELLSIFRYVKKTTLGGSK